MSPGTRFKHYTIDAEIYMIEHLQEIPKNLDEPAAIIATIERFSREGSFFGQIFIIIAKKKV